MSETQAVYRIEKQYIVGYSTVGRAVYVTMSDGAAEVVAVFEYGNLISYADALDNAEAVARMLNQRMAL